MSQESVRQAAPRSALDAQALLRNECADRGRRLEGLAVIVMTSLGECAAAGRRAAGRRGATRDDRDDGLSVSPAAASSGCSSSLSGLRSGSNRDVTDRRRASQPTARQHLSAQPTYALRRPRPRIRRRRAGPAPRWPSGASRPSSARAGRVDAACLSHPARASAAAD
jgi:hypothetical protein